MHIRNIALDEKNHFPMFLILTEPLMIKEQSPEHIFAQFIFKSIKHYSQLQLFGPLFLNFFHVV